MSDKKLEGKLMTLDESVEYIADIVRANPENFKSYLPEDKSTRCGWNIFSLRKGHPFEPACAQHDKIFDDKENKIPTEGRKAADTALLNHMLLIAKANKSRWLKLQAYMLWGVARVTGRIFW